jgi:hypothetical protein
MKPVSMALTEDLENLNHATDSPLLYNLNMWIIDEKKLLLSIVITKGPGGLE